MVARRQSSRDKNERGGGRDRDRGGSRDRDRERGRDEERNRNRDRGGDRDRGGRDRDRGGKDRSDDRGSRRNDRSRDERSERRTPSRGKGGGGGGSYKYKERDADYVRSEANRRGGSFDNYIKSGLDRWKAREGDNAIRVLPPTWEPFNDCVYPIWVHGFIGPDSSSYLCLRKMKNEPCPICEESQRADKAGDKEEAKNFRPSERRAMWIVDREDRNSPPRVYFYDMSFRQWQDILKVSMDRKSGKVLSIDHPDEGYDLYLSRSGAGEYTRYSGFGFDRDSSPICDDERDQKEVMDFVVKNPIPDILNFYDYDYLDGIISGSAPERDEDSGGDDDDTDGDDDNGDNDRRGRGRDRGGRDQEDADDDDNDDAGGDDTDGDDDGDGDEDAGDDNGEADGEEDADGGPGPRGRDRDRGSRDRGSRDRGGDRDRDPPPERRGGRDRGSRDDDRGGGRDRGGSRGGGRGGSGGGGRRYRD